CVKTVQVKAGGTMKLASAGPSQPVAPMTTTAAPQARANAPETSSAIVATAESSKVVETPPPPPAPVAKPEVVRTEPVRNEPARTELPPQPPGFGTGNGVLGVLPASSVAAAAPAPAPP